MNSVGVFSTVGGTILCNLSTVGDIMIHVGDIMSTVGGSNNKRFFDRNSFGGGVALHIHNSVPFTLYDAICSNLTGGVNARIKQSVSGDLSQRAEGVAENSLGIPNFFSGNPRKLWGIPKI